MLCENKPEQVNVLIIYPSEKVNVITVDLNDLCYSTDDKINQYNTKQTIKISLNRNDKPICFENTLKVYNNTKGYFLLYKINMKSPCRCSGDKNICEHEKTNTAITKLGLSYKRLSLTKSISDAYFDDTSNIEMCKGICMLIQMEIFPKIKVINAEESVFSKLKKTGFMIQNANDYEKYLKHINNQEYELIQYCFMSCKRKESKIETFKCFLNGYYREEDEIINNLKLNCLNEDTFDIWKAQFKSVLDNKMLTLLNNFKYKIAKSYCDKNQLNKYSYIHALFPLIKTNFYYIIFDYYFKNDK